MATTTIYFATNRKPNRKTNPTNFGKGFSKTNLGDIRFGYAKVTDGKLNTSSIKVLPDNPKKGSQALFDELRGAMKIGKTDSLIFIHGFNVSFKEAIESAAEMGDFYFKLSKKSYKPNIFVFSWPSDGKMTNYSNDRHDAETSGYAFVRGMMKLSTFLKSSDPDVACKQKIHLIAHSMGNYVLRHALQQANKIAGGGSPSRIFDNIILTAADEDSDAFEFDYKLAQLPNLAQRITVYFNSGDLALKISDYTKGNPDRMGHDGPDKPHEIHAKVVLVDASSVVTGLSEHSYHQENKIVARDIISVLQGKGSEQFIHREYVPHANKFKLLKLSDV